MPSVEYSREAHPKTIKSDFNQWMIQYQPDVLVSVCTPLIGIRSRCPHAPDWYWRLWIKHVDRICLGNRLTAGDRTTWIIAQEKRGGTHFHALAKFSGRLWRDEIADAVQSPNIQKRCHVLAGALLKSIHRHTPEVIGQRTEDRLVDVRPAWLPTDGRYSHPIYVLKERWHDPTDGLLILPAPTSTQ